MTEKFSNFYRALLHHVMASGVDEFNNRTDSRIKMTPAGAHLCVDLSDGALPTCGLRKTRPRNAAAELAWCLRGDNHVNWLRRWTKTWDGFAEMEACDGCAYEPNANCSKCYGLGHILKLREAYGHRWRSSFGFDQLQSAMWQLERDPTNRRIWITSWDPRDLLPLRQKTVPCPVGFTLSIVRGRLNSTLMIRSSDLYHGLPMDVMRHALLMDSAAATLCISPGHMNIMLAHPHVYERQWPYVLHMLSEENLPSIEPDMQMPRWAIESIMRSPDDYVRLVDARAAECEWPDYDPRSEVVK